MKTNLDVVMDLVDAIPEMATWHLSEAHRLVYREAYLACLAEAGWTEDEYDQALCDRLPLINLHPDRV